jgi:hypothetical protein
MSISEQLPISSCSERIVGLSCAPPSLAVHSTSTVTVSTPVQYNIVTYMIDYKRDHEENTVPMFVNFCNYCLATSVVYKVTAPQ